MFKLQLPLMKGTELFPDANRPPTIVRLSIVTPALLNETDEEVAADLGHKIVQTNAPRILSFYNSEIAAYDLSGGEGYHFRRIEFPQGEVSTTFVSGQPIVEITVYPEYPTVEFEEEFARPVKMGVVMEVSYHWDSKYSFVMLIDGEPYPKRGNYEIVDTKPPEEPVEFRAINGIFVNVTEPLEKEPEGIVFFGGYDRTIEADPQRDDRTYPTKNGIVFIDLSNFFTRGRKRKAEVEFQFFKDYAEPDVKTGETITYSIGSMEFDWTPYTGEYWWYVNEDGRWCFGYYGGPEPNYGWARNVDYIFNGDWYYKVTWQTKVEPYPVTLTSGPQPYKPGELPRPTPGRGGYTLAQIQGYFGVSYSYANSPPSGNYATSGGGTGPSDWYDRYDIWGVRITSLIPTVTDIMTPRSPGGIDCEFVPDWDKAIIGYLDPELNIADGAVNEGYLDSKVEWWFAEWTQEQLDQYIFRIRMPSDKTGLIETRKFTIPAKYFDEEYVKRMRRKYAQYA